MLVLLCRPLKMCHRGGLLYVFSSTSTEKSRSVRILSTEPVALPQHFSASAFYGVEGT
jgi:hypothetical protein